MMGKEDYATTGGTLKLKGVKDSKVEKKKKKKKPKPETETEDTEKQPTSNKHEGNEVEDPTRETDQDAMALDVAFVGKTEAERRHEEMRRQRVSNKKSSRTRQGILIEYI